MMRHASFCRRAERKKAVYAEKHEGVEPESYGHL